MTTTKLKDVLSSLQRTIDYLNGWTPKSTKTAFHKKEIRGHLFRAKAMVLFFQDEERKVGVTQ